MFYWSWAGGLVLNVSLRTAAPSELLTKILDKDFCLCILCKTTFKKNDYIEVR